MKKTLTFFGILAVIFLIVLIYGMIVGNISTIVGSGFLLLWSTMCLTGLGIEDVLHLEFEDLREFIRKIKKI